MYDIFKYESGVGVSDVHYGKRHDDGGTQSFRLAGDYELFPEKYQNVIPNLFEKLEQNELLYFISRRRLYGKSISGCSYIF